MASSGGIWGPAALRLLRIAMANTTKVIRSTVTDAAKPFQNQLLQPAPIRAGSSSGRPSLNPAAVLTSQKKRGARCFSAGSAKNINHFVRQCVSSEGAAAPRFDRTKLPKSQTSQQVARSSGLAPFASTLRPNLTGGVMPRTAGGYSLGGNARYFSHTPTAPAQVIQNVSQAMRAFFVSGQRIQYDGIGARGEAQYRAVSALEDEAMRKMARLPRFAPGGHIDFKLSPTITALGPLAAALMNSSGKFDFDAQVAVAPSLNTDGFLDVLSADFGRALKDLTAVYADIQRLSALGDLPISLEGDNVLRVRFPGLDAESVEHLCEDIGVQRGIIGQDQDLEFSLGAHVALRYPFAPDVSHPLSSPGGSERSLEGHELEEMPSFADESFVNEAFAYQMDDNPWASELDSSEGKTSSRGQREQASEDYEGLESIYRFLEECDRAKRRMR